jgi:opacity protein-like surface antigen
MKYFLLLICIMLAFSATASAQAVQSVYTDLSGKTCKTLEEDADSAGYMLEQCRGVAGYKLQVVSQDDRQTVVVVKPDGSKHELDLGVIGGGGFSGLRGKAEWRIKRQKGKIVPIALIIRLDVSTDPSDSTKITSFLSVSKITPQNICYIEAIDPSPDANVKARKLADSSADKPCYKLESGN